MNTLPLYYDDPYCERANAVVTRILDEGIMFDQSIFYPTGGGQPGDTGEIVTANQQIIRVIDTRKHGETSDQVHVLEGDALDHLLKVGDEVQLRLDWDRRYRLMRMHTCLHLLASFIPGGVTGGSVGEIKSRLDFDLGEHRLDKDELTRQLNEAIALGKPVLVEAIDEEELDRNPDLVRTMSVQPPRGTGSIRMIHIKGVDYQPCGGTHLKDISEIGRVRVSKIENKGKRNRRVNIVFDDSSQVKPRG